MDSSTIFETDESVFVRCAHSLGTSPVPPQFPHGLILPSSVSYSHEPSQDGHVMSSSSSAHLTGSCTESLTVGALRCLVVFRVGIVFILEVDGGKVKVILVR